MRGGGGGGGGWGGWGGCFFFNDTATTEIYTLSLHDALPISDEMREVAAALQLKRSRVSFSTRPGPTAAALPKGQRAAYVHVQAIRADEKPQDLTVDRKSTRLNSSHIPLSRMPSSA